MKAGNPVKDLLQSSKREKMMFQTTATTVGLEVTIIIYLSGTLGLLSPFCR